MSVWNMHGVPTSTERGWVVCEPDPAKHPAKPEASVPTCSGLGSTEYGKDVVVSTLSRDNTLLPSTSVAETKHTKDKTDRLPYHHHVY